MYHYSCMLWVSSTGRWCRCTVCRGCLPCQLSRGHNSQQREEQSVDATCSCCSAGHVCLHAMSLAPSGETLWSTCLLLGGLTILCTVLLPCQWSADCMVCERALLNITPALINHDSCMQSIALTHIHLNSSMSVLRINLAAANHCRNSWNTLLSCAAYCQVAHACCKSMLLRALGTTLALTA